MVARGSPKAKVEGSSPLVVVNSFLILRFFFPLLLSHRRLVSKKSIRFEEKMCWRTADRALNKHRISFVWMSSTVILQNK